MKVQVLKTPWEQRQGVLNFQNENGIYPAVYFFPFVGPGIVVTGDGMAAPVHVYFLNARFNLIRSATLMPNTMIATPQDTTHVVEIPVGLRQLTNFKNLQQFI